MCHDRREVDRMHHRIGLELDRTDDLSSDECASAYESVSEELEEYARLRRADVAIKDQDVETLVSLTADESTRRYVLTKWFYPPLGAPKQHTSVLSDLELASLEVDRVRDIWQRLYGRRNRTKNTGGPSAEEIVMRRFKWLDFPIDAEALASLRRRKGRFSRQ
jgi:hypothetical protein